MDDRFDRRELLLHLGDILNALSCLARTGSPGASVAQLMREDESLRDFELLRALAPEMTVAEFTARVASAFFSWPKELLEMELNRYALALTVQHNLFDGNPDGWQAYISHVQKKVTWFGTGLSTVKKDTLVEPSHDAANEAAPLAVSVAAAPPVEAGVRNGKRGWPWPEPKKTS